MAKLMIVPAALIAALALGTVAVQAQQAPVGAEAAAPRVKPATIRLDFGAGRKVEVTCGTTDFAACVEAITPLADKVAAMPAVPMKAEGKRDGRDGKGKHGHRGGPDKKHPGPGGPEAGRKAPEGAPPPPAKDAPQP